MFKEKDYHIFIPYLAALITFPVLFLFRSADDNRLFSWQWIFETTNAAAFFLVVIAGTVMAYVFSKTTVIERSPRVFLFFISFAAAASLWSEPELIVDASRYFTQAKHLELYGMDYFIRQWGKDITAWTDMPAVPFLFGLIFKLFGEHRLYIQIFVTILFSSTLVLTYLIGKTLWSDEIGLYAGMLLLGMPYLLGQVPLMLVDVPTMFFLAFSVFAFLKALERGGYAWIMVSAFALFLLFFSKYSAWIMLSVFGVILLVHLTKQPRIILRRFFAIVLISSLIIGIVVAWKFDVISQQIELLINYQKPGLARWGESFLSTFLFQIHPFITAAALYSAFAALRKKDYRYIMISWLVLLVVVFGIRRIRYILPILPFFALIASYGLGEIKRTNLRKIIVLNIVFTSFLITWFGYLPFARDNSAMNLKTSGEYLNSKTIQSVEVFTLPPDDPVVNPAVAVPLLDLFTKKKIRYIYSDNRSMSPKEVETSSLRFTWEHKNPRYYETTVLPQKINTAVVIISGEAERDLPQTLKRRLKGHRELKRFETAADPFRYKTYVEIYIF